MIFSKDFDLFSAIQKVRLSEKTSEILGQVSEKMKLESLAGLPCEDVDELSIAKN